MTDNMVYGPGGPPTKWEYRLFTVDRNTLRAECALAAPEDKPEGGTVEAAINKWAADGWELIPSMLTLEPEKRLLIFRRRTH